MWDWSMDGCGEKEGSKIAGKGVRGKIIERRMADCSGTNEMGVFLQQL